MPRNYELEEAYSEQLRAFSLAMKQAGYTESTQREYMREVFSFLNTLNGKLVESTVKMDVINFLVAKQGVAIDRTRDRSLSAIRSFYAALIDFEMVAKNPALEVKK